MGNPRIIHHASALAALALLSGCDLDKADDRICLTPSVEITPGDMKACAHKWAYRLARAPGTTSEIVEATLQACDDVALFNARKLNGFQARDLEYRQQILLGREEAQFRVVQARAGKCAPP